jgi:16S rRNA (guanine966-N2)-methyltransferase
VRVISGEARGHHLKGPPSFSTRPMADKIKGSLFSMLASLGVVPDRVLDLYAGTGAIGIEALSRGAEHADFVEHGSDAVAVIRANLAHTKMLDRAEVHHTKVGTFLSRAEAPYDLIILDPPYADPQIVETLTRIAQSRLVQSGSVVAIGHSPRVTLPDRIDQMARLKERCHGDCCVSIYEIENDAEGTVHEDGDLSGQL